MALYSFKGQIPKGLPHRIVLSDGTTRTDRITFTEEMLIDAGWIQVPDKPVVSYPEYVIWNGTGWEVLEKSFFEVKREKKEKITQRRYAMETRGHPTIDTSRESQAMINGVWSASQINPDVLVNFKNRDGSWSQIDANTINQIAEAVIDHVQACFDNERALHEAVDSANTTPDVLAINERSGWPDYSANNA